MPLSTRNVLNAVESTENASAHTRTVSYTVGAGTELLVVCARLSAGEIWSTNINAVRWADSGGGGDEALTQDGWQRSAGGAGALTTVWYLVNPTARSGRLEVDYTVTTSGITATSWTILEVIGGVKTAAPIGASGGAVGNALAAALNLTSTVAGSLILSGLAHANNNVEPYTPAAGITSELGDGQTGPASGSDHSYWAGECLTTSVGTYAVGATGTGTANNYAISAIEVLPAAAGKAFPFRRNPFQHILVR